MCKNTGYLVESPRNKTGYHKFEVKEDQKLNFKFCFGKFTR